MDNEDTVTKLTPTNKQTNKQETKQKQNKTKKEKSALTNKPDSAKISY